MTCDEDCTLAEVGNIVCRASASREGGAPAGAVAGDDCDADIGDDLPGQEHPGEGQASQEPADGDLSLFTHHLDRAPPTSSLSQLYLHTVNLFSNNNEIYYLLNEAFKIESRKGICSRAYTRRAVLLTFLSRHALVTESLIRSTPDRRLLFLSSMFRLVS